LYDFWYFGQVLIDNYKLVTISILHDKMRFLKKKNMHEKPLEFGRMHEYKTYFLYF
jgi:hypothetical protein